MPGDVPPLDVISLNYIQSEDAFNQAKTSGALEQLKGWVTRRGSFALSFHQVVQDSERASIDYLGLRNIPVKRILGSVGRSREFTKGFSPLNRSGRQKERWRKIYTRAITGLSYSPIEVYKYDQIYFVVNGHHRVSVAKFLGWQTIEAHVSEISINLNRAE